MTMPRILVVDDDPDILEALEVALGTQYDVVTAKDGREALDLITRVGGVALAVLDLSMPHMSGDQLMNELHARALEVPIIIASALPNVHDRAAELGAQEFLAKPFTLRELREKIASILATQGGQGSSGGPPGHSNASPDPTGGTGSSARRSLVWPPFAPIYALYMERLSAAEENSVSAGRSCMRTR